MEEIRGFGDLYKKYNFEEEEFFCRPLWHYTSADGILGIIRNEKCEHEKLHFWFTRSDCLNDSSEGSHVLDLFREICAELLQKKEITNQFYAIIKDVDIDMGQLINYPIPPDDDCFHVSVVDCAECDAFICCFSLKEDSLDMWRFYSKGSGGYGLKFLPFLFDKQKQFEHSEYNEEELFSKVRAYKVIYQTEKKRQILKEVILDAFGVYGTSISSKGEENNEVQLFIKHILKILRFQFKHECYASEEEYRFVFYRPRKRPKQLKNDLPEIKYRVQRGVIIPYLDIVVESATSYLDEVLISPYIQSKYALETTKEYLCYCGFQCVVKESKLPVQT